MFGIGGGLEPFFITILDHRHLLFSDVQLRHDIVHLIVGYGDDALAFIEDLGYDESPVEPSHILIERFVVLIPRLQEDDVVECQNQRNLATDGGCVARTVQHVEIQFLNSLWKSNLFPDRVEGASDFDDVEILRVF